VSAQDPQTLAAEVQGATKRANEVLKELASALERASSLAQSLNQAREPRREGEAPPQMEELTRRLADLESDRTELSTRLAEFEQQTGRLMNLYVATYQLHATLDPSEVQSTIGEIAVNLLGAERYALLFWKSEGNECEVALSQDLEHDPGNLFAGKTYGGGDPAVDATLSDGVLRIGPIEGSEALAVVPLTVQGTTVGALVLLKLFDHKASLRPDDRDLLDLLAAHAASALFAARVYATTDRKLKTLESLVKLVRRGGA
jgi:nitrate/nitrite-specific signal transduction histidine kinase